MNFIYSFYKKFPKQIWIYTFISLIFVARKTIFDTAREVGNYSASIDAGSSLAMIGILLGTLILMKNKNDLIHLHKKVYYYSMYYIFAICSFIWAGYLGIIAFKAIEVIVCFYLMCLTIYQIKTIKKAIYYTIFFSTVVSSIDFFNSLIKLGFHALHTNAYTMSAMIGLLLALGCIKFKVFNLKQIQLYIYLNSAYILLGTSSATYISTLIGLLFLSASSRKGINILGISILSIIIYFAYDMYSEAVIKIIFPGRSMEAIGSGTGRSKIWEACIKSWQSSPLLGQGFVVGERNLGVYGLEHNALSAHNSFFSVLVNTGIAGIIIFFIFLAKWFSKVYHLSLSNKYATIIFPVMVAALVNCNACPALGSDWGYVATCMYALIAISFLLLKRKQHLSFKKEKKHLRSY